METRDAQVRQQDLCLDGQWKRHPEALKDATKAIGGAIDPVTADVAEIEDLDRLFAEVRERHGGIDICFANAGIAMTQTSSSLQKPTP
jgi:NAD(P)-dependent dehydrogenase (short-subunit alcohol dehydrogenase family)